MVRQAGDPPPGAAPPPPVAAALQPAPLHHHAELYCAPYGEYYPPDQYYLPPPPDMCHQHPQMCTMHADYSGVGMSGGMGVPGVLQQMVDESGAVRHVLVPAHHHLPPPPPPPQHHQHHQAQQQHYGPANGGSGPTYYGPPGGFVPPHYQMAPPPPPHHVAHSPPPPPPLGVPYHKDERAHRQYVKLKRKLEQKHTNRNNGLDVNSGSSTPSPRKELLNGSGTGGSGDGGRHGGASTSSEGEGSSAAASVQGDDDESTTQLLDMLSAARPPQVSDISSYSALVQWSAPVPPGVALPTGELTYELLLGDKGRYKAIYSGPSLSCRVRDLRPGTEYSVCLQVRAGNLTGDASSAASFRAPAAPPGEPSPLRASQRSRSSLQLRWQAAQDNGARILYYLLECDSGDGNFTEIARPRTRQHAANGLKAGAKYRFRLAAVNECGRGAWSEEVTLWTSGVPPPPPASPSLLRAGPHSLHLAWATENSATDRVLQQELQMEDDRNRHGFLPVYEGPGSDHLCDGLDRRTSYKFRLRSSNDDGQSRWSAEVSFATTSEKPGVPGKPSVKGKIHSRSFRVRWDPPSDDGGAESLSYVAEIDSDDGFKPFYEGPENESFCDRLQPGTQYRIRVHSVSEGGVSEWSEVQTVTTEATCPGACEAPWLSTKPKSNSANISWRKPDYDGGAIVHEYQVDLTDSKGERQTVYVGPDNQCEIPDLLPGKDYEVQVKASNRAGVGPFSPMFLFTSDAAPPDAPQIPEASARSPFHIHVNWDEPNSNGAPVTDYHLEMSTENIEDLYLPIFHGHQVYFDVKNLTPFKTYYFRVSASNNAGMSPWSPSSTCDTPCSSPAAPFLPRAETTASTMELSWQAPANHGAPILHYLIDVGDNTIIQTDGPIEEYILEDLMPETVYKIKLIAVNEIGASSPSSTLRISTRPPPPPPPRLECVQRGHNYLKLKWGDGKNSDFTQYTVEMETRLPDDFQCVYNGTAFACKVKKLHENTTYRFRICATNDHGGEGDYSPVYEMSTSVAPPPAIAAPQITSTETNAIDVEWTPPDSLIESAGEPLLYILQCCKTKDQIYKQVYHGGDCQTRLDFLESGCEYCVRVLATRGSLHGPWSPSTKVLTLAVAPAAPVTTLPAIGQRPRRARAVAPLTDRHWAMLLLAGFMLVAVLAAAAVERFINWQRAADA